MKKFRRIIKYFFLCFLLCFLVFVYLLLWPQVMFKNKVDYRNFSIYSNENIDGPVQKIIDTTIAHLRYCEIYDSTLHQKIFFIHNTFYYTMTKIYAWDLSAYHEFSINNTMIVPEVDLKNDKMIFPDKHTQKLSQSIIHEMVHSMQVHRYGFWKMLVIPNWKQEGYAYFIARPDNILRNGKLSRNFIHRTIKWRGYKNLNRDFWLYGIMVAWVLNEKQMSFDQFMNDSIREENIKAELTNWLSEE